MAHAGTTVGLHVHPGRHHTFTLRGPPTLERAREGFQTRLTRNVNRSVPLATPPASLFSLVKYPTALGDMSAYLTPKPKEGGRHPAIIWLIGGFPPGGAGKITWGRPLPGNDQSASQYRLAGIVMLYPTLRGDFDNPGNQESFLGEVDDVLAALEYLRTVDYVDPSRIYLGGHSTGGTLALLVSEVTNEFRAVFSFGPVDRPTQYDGRHLTYDWTDAQENRVRSPIHFLHGVTSPTFIIAGQKGNSASLRAMSRANDNPALQFIEILGGNHFNYLAPLNNLLAERVISYDGSGPFRLSEHECQGAFNAREQSQSSRNHQ